MMGLKASVRRRSRSLCRGHYRTCTSRRESCALYLKGCPGNKLIKNSLGWLLPRSLGIPGANPSLRAPGNIGGHLFFLTQWWPLPPISCCFRVNVGATIMRLTASFVEGGGVVDGYRSRGLESDCLLLFPSSSKLC